MLKHYIKRYFVGASVLIAAISIFIFFQREENKKVDNNQTEQDRLDQASNDTIIETDETNETDEMKEETGGSVVDVKGEVTSPGVYQLEENQRVEDAIEAAEGFTKQADELQINLSEKVHDEMMIYVPEEGEESGSSEQSTSNTNDSSAEEQLRINQASLEEIETLNGIGPSKAEAILQHVEENGPLQSDEDFLEISGIGEKTLENFKDEITYH